MTKVYAVAESVPERCRSMITPGKRYEVVGEAAGSFAFVGDNGRKVAPTWKRSIFLDGGKWQRIEEEAPTPEQTQRWVVAEPFITDETDENDRPVWSCELQLMGGYAVQAVFYGSSADEARTFAEVSRTALAAFKKSEVGHD